MHACCARSLPAAPAASYQGIDLSIEEPMTTLFQAYVLLSLPSGAALNIHHLLARVNQWLTPGTCLWRGPGLAPSAMAEVACT